MRVAYIRALYKERRGVLEALPSQEHSSRTSLKGRETLISSMIVQDEERKRMTAEPQMRRGQYTSS